jgi:4a-hydroxytetrahydrobiopterin dehydratase
MSKIKAIHILHANEVALHLESLPLWSYNPELKTITREFKFSNFQQAFAFMTKVANASEQHNHHPEWLNVYNKINITWTTHDVQGLSIKDIQMASLCDQLFLDEPTIDR